MSYKTSNDYERLCYLMEQGEYITCGYLEKTNDIYFTYVAEYQYAVGFYCYRITNFEIDLFLEIENRDQCIARIEFIKKCKEHGIEFIDPASQEQKSVWHGPEEKPHCDSYASAVIIVFNYVDQTDKRTEIIRACSLNEVTKTRNVHKWAYVVDFEAIK